MAGYSIKTGYLSELFKGSISLFTGAKVVKTTEGFLRFGHSINTRFPTKGTWKLTTIPKLVRLVGNGKVVDGARRNSLIDPDILAMLKQKAADLS